MAVVLSQGVYLGALQNPAELKAFLLQMITQGGRGITGPNDVGYSSVSQIYADLLNRGVDLTGLPSLQEIANDPIKYAGVNGAGQPTLDNPTQAPKADAPAAPTSPVDGKQALRDELNGWGLGSLADQAWALQTAGAGQDQIVAWIRSTAEYKAAFSGLLQRQAKGLPAITEAQSLALTTQYDQIAHQYGLLPGSYDAQKAIGADVSATEFSQRAADASTAIYNEPEQVRTKLQQYYGLASGQIASWYLNPQNAEPQLQNMLHAAEIGGVGSQLGLGLTQHTAESAAAAGFTGTSARSGLAQVASEAAGGLFASGIADKNNITTEQGVQAQLGLDASAIAAVQNRQRDRAAIGQGGGGSIITSTGVLGERVAQ